MGGDFFFVSWKIIWKKKNLGNIFLSQCKICFSNGKFATCVKSINWKKKSLKFNIKYNKLVVKILKIFVWS